MKKITSFSLLIITITIISCDNEPVTVPDDFTASQGTYMGVVHLAYGDSDGRQLYTGLMKTMPSGKRYPGHGPPSGMIMDGYCPITG